MAAFITHIQAALLFCIIFAFSMSAWDLDHLQKCSVKNVTRAVINPDDADYAKENQSKGGCRGWFHTAWFALAFTALYFSYVAHMILDIKGVI